MEESSKIKLAMIAQQIKTNAAPGSSMVISGEEVVPIYPKALIRWADRILKIIEYELNLQEERKKNIK